MRPAERRLLEDLADLYGVQTSYRDVADRRQEASADALLAVLRALGAEVEGPRDLPAAILGRRRELWARLLPPVAVVWLDTGPEDAFVSLYRRFGADGPLPVELELEDGTLRSATVHLEDLEAEAAAELDGTTYVRHRLPLAALAGAEAGGLPAGYHLLRAGEGAERAECVVMAAPRRAWPGPGHTWGAFLPLYALREEDDWGVGDFAGIGRLRQWIGELGGTTVGSLPLLAAFLDRPFAPSPYTPVTRLFWNELFVSLADVPELAGCPTARERLASPGMTGRLARLRREELVAYADMMAAKREVLEELARCFFAAPDPVRWAAFESFLAARPRTLDYARFRAATEACGQDWHAWPERMRDGDLRPRDYAPEAERYHLYVQWLAEEQLRGVGEGLYLDLPLGVHPGGYDTWREGRSFAFGVAGGAPPDTFFRGGQNWGFPPLHPDQMRLAGYGYLRDALGVQMSHASVLRIDHVMGLHRLYWIPDGMPATAGVYVGYPAEELYAVLTLESVRHRTALVGEDLGTVPDYVRPAMTEHGLASMYVLGYELSPDASRPVGEVPPGTLAALNTHDMPPFAGFFAGSDVEERVRAGQLPAEAVAEECADRAHLRRALAAFLAERGLLDGDSRPADDEEDLRRLLLGALRFLAGSEAGLVLVNLEDLLLVTAPQNVPGTAEERPNWRRRLSPTLCELREIPGVREALQEVDAQRNGRRSG